MKFSDIPGHSDIKNKLINMRKNKRIGHALAFAGERGSANLALGIAFSQYICCANPGDDDSCGECPSCVKIENNAHPDIHFYFPTTTSNSVPKKPISQMYYDKWREYLKENMFVTHANWLRTMNPDRKDAIISTDDSAQIIKDLSLKSYESESLVAIIWLPEKMNVYSSNRLLKIIEEPPDNVYFFLITENLEMVLPTIISRTQSLRIGKISSEEMTKWIQKVKPDLSEEKLQNVVKSANGNPLKALKSSDDELITPELTHFFINWARLCYKAYERMPELIKCAEDLATQPREEQNKLLNYGISFFRNSLLINNAADSLFHPHASEKDHIKNFAPLLKFENSAFLISQFEKAMRHLDRYANSKILFLDLSMSFAKNINVKNVNL
jgi:DNA polymerase-3 subunit delta'